MRVTRSFMVPYDPILDRLCRVSKSLYNQALYIQKTYWDETGKFLSYRKMDKIMKQDENSANYKRLKAQVAQQILKLLDKNWKSYFKAIKEWKQNKDKFNGMPKPPHFKAKKDKFLLVYTNQSSWIKQFDNDYYVILAKDLKIKIPANVFEKEMIHFNQIRVLPKPNNKFKIEIIYHKDELNLDLDHNEYAAIDLGLNNLITMVTTRGTYPILINGRILKSINQWYNKRIAHLQSIKDKMRLKKYRTNLMKQITENRNNKINDYLYKASRYVVNYLLKHKIGNLIIGYNKNWKTNINIGSVNNQKFVQIPLNRLIQMLQYKCQLVGINVILTEESYTSKCDALAFDAIPSVCQKASDEPSKQEHHFSGRRIKRGLYQSSIGKLINADVNGALNIMRKVVHDSSLIKRIMDRGFLFNPVKIRSLFERQTLHKAIPLSYCNSI